MDTLDKFFEEVYKENVGDLPAGYTDEDLADFLDKEDQSVPFDASEGDNDYDPNDEIIQFVYKDADSEVQNKINNTFDGGYVDNSSMSTIGEFRKFVTDNELDVEDFRIFDDKGEEYFDKLSLIYDIQPNLQESAYWCSETPGYEHCANCGMDLDDATFGGELYGDRFCKGCYEHELEGLDEANKAVGIKKATTKMTEALIAGANGLVYSSEKHTAKENAADALLRKLGKLKEPGVLNEALDEDSKDIKEFYDTFYDILEAHPDEDVAYWNEAAPTDGIDFLDTYKKTHPDTKITDEDAMLLYQNFISDRLDN